LATFSAIGFIILEMININVAKELLVAAIAFAGLIGILLLWVIDLLVWSGPLLIGQFKFDYCITAYYQHIFVLAGDD